MLDHWVGKPSTAGNRAQVLLLTALSAVILHRISHHQLPHWLQALDRQLRAFSPWKIVLATWTVQYFIKRLFVVCGMGGSEPLARMYSPAYFRATWIFTAMDAGFWTAMSIQPKFLRDFLSIIFSIVYLFLPNLAEEKVRRIRQTVTIDHMRVAWEKMKNPYLQLAARLHQVPLPLCHHLNMPRPARFRPRQAYLQDHPFQVKVYFAGTSAALRQATGLLYHIPGGGFVSMDPDCHDDYLRVWARQTGLPIVSINYRKAPEFPFPYALEECFDFYRLLVETNGACIGLRGWAPEARAVPGPIRVAIVGDSAGGNLAAGVMIQTIERPQLTVPSPHPRLTQLTRPLGLLLIYGCFDFNITSWMSHLDYQRMRGSTFLKRLPSMLEVRDHLHHSSPLATKPDRPSRWRQRRNRSMAERVVLFDSQATTGLARSSSTALLRDQDQQSPDAHYGGNPPWISDGEDIINNAHYNSRVERQHSFYDLKASAALVVTDGPGHLPGSDNGTSTRLAMSSRTCFINDRILTADLQRAMAIMYVGPNRRPDFSRNYYLSPVVTPDYLLAQFPNTCLICGEKDPLVDDTIVLAARISEAKQKLVDLLRDGVDAVRSPSLPREDSRVRPPSRFRSFVQRHALKPLTPLTDSPLASSARFFTGASAESGNTASESEFGDEEADEEVAEQDRGLTAENGTAPRARPTPSQRLDLGWRQLLQDSPRADLDNLVLTTTHVQIIEGISHGFLQMMPIYPTAKDLVRYMGDTITNLLAVDPTPPGSPVNGLAASDPRQQAPRNADTSGDSPVGGVRGHSPLVSGSDTPVHRSDTSERLRPLATLKRTSPPVSFSLPDTPPPGAVSPTMLVPRRRADMAAALGSVPRIDIPLGK
ncbi:hypothetical protein H4R33_000773 [Dimargaris cristalligena]|nr:hypothetical protein H4R33_000773 [Dimargaris cristalligena]